MIWPAPQFTLIIQKGKQSDMTQTGAVKKTQQFELEGRGVITLRPSDHVATGGEGSVYKASSKTLIKLYSDPLKMQRDRMEEKIRLLMPIKHPFIVSPKGLVFANGKAAGFYMDYERGDPLARVFTSAYWQREQFDLDSAIKLVEGMREVICEAHAHKAILVDANEFNWLVNRIKKDPEPRVIDVDSWAIGKFKASVIMPSIRDWHTTGFNEDSDWFSFGVVSFQVFSGVHPYKGMLDGYAPNDIEKRMKANLSVFSKGVRLNSAVRDFKQIPKPLLDWYHDLFQNGRRSQAPSLHSGAQPIPKAALVRRTIVVGPSDLLSFELLFDGFSDPVVELFPAGVLRLKSGKLIHLVTKRVIGQCKHNECEVVDTEGGLLLAELDSAGKLECNVLKQNGQMQAVPSQLTAEKLLRYENRLFLVGDRGLTELKLKQIGKPFLVATNTWPALSNSTHWFNGLGVQDSLGATYLVLPFGEDSCSFVRTPELDGKKIADAVSGSRYAAIIALDPKTGDYEQHEFVFNKDYSNYAASRETANRLDLNLAVLPKGVAVSVPEDGKLKIFVPTNGQEKIVSDSHIQSSFNVTNWLNTAAVISGSQLWSITMK